MQIIRQPEKFYKEIECRSCHAILLVEEDDLKIGKFPLTLTPEKFEYCAYFVCPVCGAHITVEYSIHKLVARAREVK